MQSRIQYCCETWGAWEPRGNQVILQRLQAACNKFFRLIIYNLDQRDSVRSLLKSNNVLNMNQIYNYSVCKTMHRAKYGFLPAPLCRIFEQSLGNSVFDCPNPRIKRTEKSIHYAGPKIWNSLSNVVINESEFKKFQSGLKKIIIETV